jgi:predicted RNA binding protein YcfA (HicA-like mRNA interferase family)
MAGRLPSITYRQLIRALERDGWYVTRVTGHVILIHPDRPGSVPVPNHPSKQAKPSLLRAILNQTGVSPERLRELL